jgi:hypothetical protein
MRARWVLAAIAACHAQNPIAKQDLATAFVDAECAYLARCGLFPDAATCERAYIGVSFTVDATRFAAIDAGVIKYDGAAARTCIDSYASASCDLTAESARVRPDACDHVVTGTLGDGASCALDEECVSKRCTIPMCTVTCCKGTCTGNTAPTRQPIGGSCANVSCAAGGYCDITSFTCTALVAKGGSCTGDYQCAYGIGCIASSQTCGALPTIGQACPDNRCRDLGTTCSASAACAKVGLPSASCTTRADCSQYYTCDATSHCAEGSAIGGPCASSGDCFPAHSYCAIPTGATAGTCAAPQADGTGPCTADRDCASNNCEDTTALCTELPSCV